MSVSGAASETRRHAINHVVLLWFKTDIPQHQRVLIATETDRPGGIPGVRQVRYGKAIPARRRIVDDSFDLGVYMQFDSEADRRACLVYPQHVNFVKQHLKPWLKKIIVYNFYY